MLMTAEAETQEKLASLRILIKVAIEGGEMASSERQCRERRSWYGKLLKLLSLGVYRKFPLFPFFFLSLSLFPSLFLPNFLCVSSVSLPQSPSMTGSCYVAQAGLELSLSPWRSCCVVQAGLELSLSSWRSCCVLQAGLELSLSPRGSCYVAKAGLELAAILVPYITKCWGLCFILQLR